MSNQDKREGAIIAYTWVLDNLDKMDRALLREHIYNAIKTMQNEDSALRMIPSNNG